MRERNILRKDPRNSQDVGAKLAAGWARVGATSAKGKFADAIGVRSTTTVDNALTGKTVPELHTALNSLLYDPTALDEVMALYGLRVCPRDAEAANDMETIHGLSGAVTEWVSRLMDGKRCHRDTLALANIFRPLIAEMQAIVHQADAA